WNRSLSPGWQLAAGAQLELPVGAASHGIASDHTEVLPYARLSLAWERFHVSTSAGVRLAVGEHEHVHEDEHGAVHVLHTPGSGSAVLYVNPHEGRELVYRAVAEYALLDRRVRPGL